MDCFNPRLYEVGARYQRTVRLTDLDQQQWVLTYDLLVIRNFEYSEGVPATETSGQVGRYPAGQPENTESHSYRFFTTNIENSTVPTKGENHGDTPFTDPPPGGPPRFANADVTYSNYPARILRYDLQAGANFTQNYQVIKEYLIMSPTDDADVESTIGFLGTEQVSVPAGTFDTCRFDETRTEERFWDGESQGTFVIHTKSWFGVGNGLLIRYERDGEIYELIDASIDGEPITGR